MEDENTDLLSGQQESSETPDIAETDLLTGELGEALELDGVEQILSSQKDTSFSFTETVRQLLKGELPFDGASLLEWMKELLLGELIAQRKMILQILVVVLASAIFSNFVRVFQSSQIADISFYMLYLLIATLLLQSYLSISRIVEHTCTTILSFMKVLLPSYLVTVVFCAGSVTAIGFYEIIVLGMNLIQVLILRVLLPMIHVYLLVLLLNQLAQEDYFSRFAKLIETIVGWSIKTVLGLVVGLQAVQALVAPAVDQLKQSSVHRVVKAIPGVGSILDSAAETVAGSAVVLKNAVGVAGILALLVLGITPLVKLAVCILMFRLLCAMIQPICDKRMVEGIESISGAAMLLLKLLSSSMAVFVISLAMITAATGRGS
jgi:stage III sporulation protein AE